MATYILEKEYITKEEFEEMMKDEGAIESYIASLSTNNAN
jgi:hypothetical protein